MKRQSGIQTKSASAQIKKALRELGTYPRNSLGQHFLIDEEVLRDMLQAAELASQDTVIEIGPGLGILTKELAHRVRQVITVETDSKLASVLHKDFDSVPNIAIVEADILQTDITALLPSPTTAYKVVADIPYYITSPILRHFLEAPVKPSCMVLMVQREVGEAIAAQPGKMSLLAVSVQFYGNPVIVSHVPSQSFYPAPKVDSVIIRIDIYDHPKVDVADINQFFDVVRAGFSAPRKQLRNSLAQGLNLPPQQIEGLLDMARVNPKRRAETLDLPEWASVYEIAVGLRTE